MFRNKITQNDPNEKFVNCIRWLLPFIHCYWDLNTEWHPYLYGNSNQITSSCNAVPHGILRMFFLEFKYCDTGVDFGSCNPVDFAKQLRKSDQQHYFSLFFPSKLSPALKKIHFTKNQIFLSFCENLFFFCFHTRCMCVVFSTLPSGVIRFLAIICYIILVPL